MPAPPPKQEAAATHCTWSWWAVSSAQDSCLPQSAARWGWGSTPTWCRPGDSSPPAGWSCGRSPPSPGSSCSCTWKYARSSLSLPWLWEAHRPKLPSLLITCMAFRTTTLNYTGFTNSDNLHGFENPTTLIYTVFTKIPPSWVWESHYPNLNSLH